MDVAQLARPQLQARNYSWTLVLPRPRPGGTPLRAEALTASEQMFFFGAPVAHVIAYEEQLRRNRQERTIRQISRARRTFDFAAQLEALRQTSPARAETNAG